MSSLQQIIADAAARLPHEGLVTEFCHRNQLAAWEQLPFQEAARLAAAQLGCEPYLTEYEYRRELQLGRIRESDLRAVLTEDLRDSGDEVICVGTTRFDVRLAMLLNSICTADHDDLQWLMVGSRFLERFHDNASIDTRNTMIEQTRRLLAEHFGAGSPAPGRSREERAWASLLDSLRDQFDVSTCERWSDQMWEAFSLHVLAAICRNGVKSVGQTTARPQQRVRYRDLLLQATGHDADLAVHRILVPFCSALLDQGVTRMELPGRENGFYRAFIALYRQGPAPHPSLYGLGAELARLDDAKLEPLDAIQESLELLGVSDKETSDFIAESLWALRGWAGRLWYAETQPDRMRRPAPPGSLVEFLAIRLLLDRLASAHLGRERLGFDGPLRGLRKEGRTAISPSGDTDVERKAFVIFQLAQVFGWQPLALHGYVTWQWATLAWEVEHFGELERRRIFQSAYERCYQAGLLDALATDPRTPGRPPFQFQAVFCCSEREEAIRRRLEDIAPDGETFGAVGHFGVAMYYRGLSDDRYRPRCPAYVRATHCVHEIRSVSDQSVLPGFFSRLANSLQRSLCFDSSASATNLQLQCHQQESGAFPGYTADEMVAICEELLTDVGLVMGFAPLILLIAHGAGELNRNHASRFDCGVCGSADGANSRALAKMLNDDRVRLALAERGIDIPSDSVFVGGFHDTSTQSVRFFELEVPESHREGFYAIERALDWACQEEESRLPGLPQLDFGHMGNAACIVGRRGRTHGLPLDGRVFLTSYDPLQDGDGAILMRLVADSVIPCIDVNLQYYFSRVDPSNWGCGNTLPWQASSPLGVVEEATGDLRSGLAWPFVRDHEPRRLLVVVETTLHRMLQVMSNNERFDRLCRHGWVQLVALDPESPTLHCLRDGQFVPHEPSVALTGSTVHASRTLHS